MDISKYSKEELEAEIKRREEEERNKKGQLPKQVVVYAYGRDDDDDDFIEQGFSEKQIDALGLNRLAYEVSLRFMVHENHKIELIAINGVPLVEPIGWN